MPPTTTQAPLPAATAWRGLVLVCLTGVIWGTIGPGIDLVYDWSDLTPLTIGAHRAIFAVVTLWAGALLTGRFTLLLVMQPGNRGIRRHNKTADPVVCLYDGCFVSSGAGTAATFLPGQKALGFGNTWGGRAGACRAQLGCVFRGLPATEAPVLLQPVDMHILKHDRRRPQAVVSDSACRMEGARLVCLRGIYADDYSMWIVPEDLAATAGPEALQRRLLAVDPVSAGSIERRNVRRMIRALEVSITLGRPFSEVGHERGTPLPSVRLVLSMPREEIYRRVDLRVDAMIAAGWLEEARSLLARGYDETLPSISSHGYREMVAVVKGRMSLAEAAQKTKWAIHAYVRRQTSWLKSQPNYDWIDAGPGAIEAASALVEPFLREGERRES